MSKTLFIISLTLFSTLSYAEHTQGKALFDEQNCIKCHALKQFSPKENKITNFTKLNNRVEGCSFGNKTGWFDDEIRDVSSYLNANFYHFKEPKREDD